MIKLHFYDWECSYLDIEKELGIEGELGDFEDVIDYLEHNVSGLSFEALDQEFDMENNVILYFSGEDEDSLISQIRTILETLISNSSRMKYTITKQKNFD